MKANPLFLLEFVLFNGVVLVWAFRELWSVRPDKPPDGEKASSPEDPGHTEG